MLRISSTILKFGEQQRQQIARLQKRSAEEFEALSPEFAYKVEIVLHHLENKGWVPVVFHGERTKAQQAQKVKAGYSKTMNSFHVAGTALSKGGNGMYWQVKGEAADIVDARYLWSGPAASLDFQFWKDLGSFAKSIGLSWGGDWKKFRDVAHVELTHREFSQDTRGQRV